MLDVDICGPSIPVMMGVEGHQVHSSIHLLIHPSPHPSISSSIHLLIHPSSHPSIFSLTYQSSHPSPHSFIFSSIHPPTSFLSLHSLLHSFSYTFCSSSLYQVYYIFFIQSPVFYFYLLNYLFQFYHQFINFFNFKPCRFIRARKGGLPL